MSQYPSGSAPPYQHNPHISSNPSDQKSQLANDTIRLVNPTTPFPAPNAHADPGMNPAEANYWKARQGEQAAAGQAQGGYADPYEYLNDGDGNGQGYGHGQVESSGHAAGPSPYGNPAGASSDPTIGPWDSASQRSNSLRAQNASALGYGSAGARGAGGAGGAALSGIDEERGQHQGSIYGAYGGPAGDANVYGGHGGGEAGYANPYSFNNHGTGALGKDYPYAQAEEYEMRGLVSNAAGMGTGTGYAHGDPSRPGYGGTGGPSDRSSKYGLNTADEPYSWPPLEDVNANSHMRKESPLMAILLFPTGLDRLLALVGVNKGRMPVQQQVERKKHGVPGQRWPVATWVLTAGESYLVNQKNISGRSIA